ncbi:hypothetical protein LJC38_05875 [Parabacteroides sp. OttesenSCG-928-K15]|nr:hypothetical protein [Parabacteroides sp. OttesenSCG-928-K15]
MKTTYFFLVLFLGCLLGCKQKNPNLTKEELLLSLEQQEKEIEAEKKKRALEVPEGYIPPAGDTWRRNEHLL